MYYVMFECKQNSEEQESFALGFSIIIIKQQFEGLQYNQMNCITCKLINHNEFCTSIVAEKSKNKFLTQQVIVFNLQHI